MESFSIVVNFSPRRSPHLFLSCLPAISSSAIFSIPNALPATGTRNSPPRAVSRTLIERHRGKPLRPKLRHTAMMKTILAASVLAVFRFPGSGAGSAANGFYAWRLRPQRGAIRCKANDKQHPVAPSDASKALVYVFEDMEHGPTMRVGLDGAWIGANKGKSYFFFSVTPAIIRSARIGNRVPSRKRRSASVRPSLSKRKAGKVYYLRTQVYERSEQDRNVKLEPVESAKANF